MFIKFFGTIKINLLHLQLLGGLKIPHFCRDYKKRHLVCTVHWQLTSWLNLIVILLIELLINFGLTIVKFSEVIDVLSWATWSVVAVRTCLVHIQKQSCGSFLQKNNLSSKLWILMAKKFTNAVIKTAIRLTTGQVTWKIIWEHTPVNVLTSVNSQTAEKHFLQKPY